MTDYRVGIIGCGGISHMHANWYRGEPQTELVAAADINLERLNAFEKFDLDSENFAIGYFKEDWEHRSSGYQGRAPLEVLMAIYELSQNRRRVHLPLGDESSLTLMIQDGWV